MGAWYHVRARWPEVVGRGRLIPIARPESATPPREREEPQDRAAAAGRPGLRRRSDQKA